MAFEMLTASLWFIIAVRRDKSSIYSLCQNNSTLLVCKIVLRKWMTKCDYVSIKLYLYNWDLNFLEFSYPQISFFWFFQPFKNVKYNSQLMDWTKVGGLGQLTMLCWPCFYHMSLYNSQDYSWLLMGSAVECPRGQRERRGKKQKT